MSIKYGIWIFIICFLQRFYSIGYVNFSLLLEWYEDWRRRRQISSHHFSPRLLSISRKDRQSDRQSEIQTDSQTGKQSDRHIGDTQTDRQTHFMIILQVCWLSHNFDSNWFDLGDERYYLPELNFSFHFNFYLFIRPSNWKNRRFVYALFV